MEEFLSEFKEQVMAAEVVNLFEEEGGESHPVVVGLLDLADELEGIGSVALIRSRVRREIENNGMSIEDYFEACTDDPDCRDIDHPVSHMGEILKKAMKGDICEEDVEDEQNDFIMHALAAAYCAAAGLTEFKPTVTVAA